MILNRGEGPFQPIPIRARPDQRSLHQILNVPRCVLSQLFRLCRKMVMNSRPIILRFCSGSLTPYSFARNCSEAATPSPAAPAARGTFPASAQLIFPRSPVFTQMVVSRSPIVPVHPSAAAIRFRVHASAQPANRVMRSHLRPKSLPPSCDERSGSLRLFHALHTRKENSLIFSVPRSV